MFIIISHQKCCNHDHTIVTHLWYIRTSRYLSALLPCVLGTFGFAGPPPPRRFGIQCQHLNMILAQLPPWIPKKDAKAFLHIYWWQLCEEFFSLQENSLRDFHNSEIPSNSTPLMGNIPIEPTPSSNAAEEAKGGHRFRFLRVLSFKFNFKWLLWAVSFHLVWKNEGRPVFYHGQLVRISVSALWVSLPAWITYTFILNNFTSSYLCQILQVVWLYASRLQFHA